MGECPASLTVTVPMTCERCGAPWNDLTERWRVYLSSDTPPAAYTYCLDCARLEFDD
jgi:hypothetical protein